MKKFKIPPCQNHSLSPMVGKRPPLPLRLRLCTPQPLTRVSRRRLVDKIYKIDRSEKRELGHWPMHAADLPRRQCVTGTVSQGSDPVDTHRPYHKSMSRPPALTVLVSKVKIFDLRTLISSCVSSTTYPAGNFPGLFLTA